MARDLGLTRALLASMSIVLACAALPPAASPAVSRSAFVTSLPAGFPGAVPPVVNMPASWAPTSFRTEPKGGGPWLLSPAADRTLWVGVRSGLGRLTRAGKLTVPGPISGDGLPWQSMSAGSDGSLWLTKYADSRVYRRAPGGSVKALHAYRSDGQTPSLGGNGTHHWFVGGHALGYFVNSGALTRFPLPAGLDFGRDNRSGLVSAVDGGIWFLLPHRGARGVSASSTDLVHISLGGTLTRHSLPLIGTTDPIYSPIGEDRSGNVWVTWDAAPSTAQDATSYLGVARFDRDGTWGVAPVIVQDFPGGEGVTGGWWALGADGAVWSAGGFSGGKGADVLRVDSSGRVTRTYLKGAPCCIAYLVAGPDGNMWLSNYGAGGRVWRLHTGRHLVAPTTRVSGHAAVGHTVSCSPTATRFVPTRATFQWRVNGSLRRASGSAVVVRHSWRGKSLSCTIDWRAPGTVVPLKSVSAQVRVR